MSITGTAKKALGTVTSGRAYLDNLIDSYILRPVNAYGIGGFVFDYEGETSVNLSADITDHYAEDNTAIQDHIALRPAKLVLRGFVSELIMENKAGLSGFLNLVNQRLETAEAYLGSNTPQMAQKMQAAVTAASSAVNVIDQAINRANNIVGMLSSAAPGQTRQQNAYMKLESLWRKKQIFTVETPYRFFEYMAIENIAFVQDEDNRYQSSLAVTVKEMRFAGVEFTKFNDSLFAGRAAQQKQVAADKGKTKGTTGQQSTLFNFFYPEGVAP